ncbi:MAG TPA: VCBS repeat-containing protein [Flavobacteriaceae bacterium]|nr:VCBS repeat-containing protein [Flavobacteriaceae bacterium]MCB9213927.1 VCBS repeat-containing protein [Alteromonas sp.]HPF11088.1 VCBS repeat-containing protein [Flavobacteriaceae bacterium]HQU21244.1 VCBS repeat-containing protein [Flavobacteriaceae bacterium]HQU65716.1 VCBS repeat-containing protein [Flavobacteriaceae bacterium]
MTRNLLKYYGLCLILLLVSCKEQEPSSLFHLLPSSQSGVDFQNTVVETDSLNILDYLYFYNGGGLAMGDINNDGLPDLYFSSNQQKNHLYLNKGNLKFEDISEKAGVNGNSSWNTGAIMVDVNGDGWLDIYVMAVVGINGFEGHNELFVNNRDNTFTELSAQYGLDLQCYGTSAAFLDYDLDGDLDLYVLNHAVHTQESFGRAQIRNQRNEKTGDRLLRNDGNRFTDVSEEAGIYGGINGYGLGVSVADFNQDGYPDIYVGNDFHEDDYFYLNNGDGTFTESLKTYFGHTSRFSMGNDAADINHDGWPDLISLDMLPEDDAVIKSSEGDDMYQTLKMRTQQYGYHYQYSRNMLFVSDPEKAYSETALLSGIAATDWSWSALFADYDLDGEQDLFISNGIPKRPNNLDYIKFISNDQIQQKLNDGRLVDQKALEMMPSGKVCNYFFKGNKELLFTDVSKAWGVAQPSISGATVLGDLDNDGDLDLVTNNINEPASIYINQSKNASYLELKFDYPGNNPQGYGTKVYCYLEGKLQYKELYTVRGFQASSEPLIHFGLGTAKQVDSLTIVWPNRTQQTLKNVPTNQLLVLKPENTTPFSYTHGKKLTLFQKVETNLGIDYEHKEDEHTDFNYQKLIPYEVCDRGPAMAVGDWNGDGLEDVFLGGAHNQKSQIFIRKGRAFERLEFPEMAKDSASEDVSATLFNGNLIVGSGGNVVSPSKKILLNRWYKYSGEGSQNLTGTYENTEIVTEHDGYLFIGNHSTPLDFGSEVPSYILKPNGAKQELSIKGMVTNALWDDFDADGEIDLIVVGEWMDPAFFKNNNGNFEEVYPLKQSLKGLWESIVPFDIDGDGDKDYLLGNWGLNSKFTATAKSPMKMYYADFDQNGNTETIVAVQKNGKYFPLLGLDDLAGQMVFLRKKFNNYKDFAGKTIEEIMGDKLSMAKVYEVNNLASGFLRNTNNSFTFEPFQSPMQWAPIMAWTVFDFNGDGKEEALAGGNYFGVIPFHGRFDSFPGALIASEKEITLGSDIGLELTQKSVRHLTILHINQQPYLLVVYNNEKAEVYEIKR